jgi:hypothetical protein
MTDLQKHTFPSLTLKTNDGNLQAFSLINDLINPCLDLNLENQLQYCLQSVDSFKDLNYPKNVNYNKYLTRSKDVKKTIDKKASGAADLFSKLNSYTINQMKNQTLRFGLDTSGGDASSFTSPRQSWAFKPPFSLTHHNSHGNISDSREYEDVLSVEILHAPICDLCIISQGEAVPDGFFRFYKTPHNKKANLNSGSGGNGIYLCVKKDLTGQIAPITNIIVIFPDRNEHIPPGYHFIHRGETACNLNTGTGAERIYLCYKKDFLSNPITDIQLIFTSKGETPPKSFQLIDRSISGLQANLNVGTGGLDTYLTYKQDLIRFYCLLNEGDPESEKGGTMKRRYTKEEYLLRRSSMGGAGDAILSSENGRSRSRSPLPRGRLRSGSNINLIGEGGTSGRNSNNNSEKAKAILLKGDEHSNSGDSLKDLPQIVDDAGSPLVSSLIPAMTKVKFEPTIILDTPEKLDNSHDLDASDNSVVLLDDEEEWPDLPEEILNPKEMEQASLRKGQEVVDSNGDKVPLRLRKALLAILSTIYVRQGSLWEIAIQGLVKIFKDTDFFTKDMENLPLPATVTMLDLTIEAVCDRFDLSPETDQNKLLEFLRIIIKHSGARLAAFSLQRMYKAISYISTIQATKSNWITNGWNMPCSDPLSDVTPFRVLKQLIWDTVAQVETTEIASLLPDSDYFAASFDVEELSPNYFDIRILVEDLIDDIIDSVEVSRLCETIMLTISKQSLTVNSSTFWYSMNNFSRKLFVDPLLRSAFIALAVLSKQAWHGIRKAKNGDAIPRDLGSKLVALEALMEYCNCAGEKMKSSKIMGYTIRRIVVPCIMFNVAYGLCDHRIFSKLLRIVTALWKNWRRHIRIEFAILCEQIVFKVLQGTVLQIRPIYQMVVIQEVENWFDQPHMLIEMFVNYDMDRKFVSHWNTFSYLVRSMCAIGRRLSLVTGAWDWKPGGTSSQAEENNRIVISIRDVHLQALHEVCRMAKTLMDASGHAFLIQQDSEFRLKSLGENAGWVEDEETSAVKSSSGKSNETSQSDAVTSDGDQSQGGSILSPGSTSNHTSRRSRAGSIKLRRAAHQESEELIQQAIKIYTEKSSLKKAVEFLISKGFMADTPQEIANFLRVYKNSFDPSAIGEFLGEGGTNPAAEDYWSQIRFRYTRAVSFVEMDIEPALRLYLTGCGFRLPGEAQKINRFVEVFVKVFWQDNSGTQYCPFKHTDTVHLLSYAIIMLNTDLHRANAGNDHKKGKNKKMTKDEFISNLRGCDQGSDVNREVLSSIYDNIANQPIELAFKTSNEFEENLKKDSSKADDMVNSVLTTNNKASNDIRAAEEKKFILDLGQSLRDSEDLLRSLSPFTYRFHLTNVDTKISLDLVSYMYETVWFHFHAIVEAIFNMPSADTDIKFVALDVLCYSLTSALFLNLKMERMAFAILLSKFRKTCDALPHVVSSERAVPDDSWYQDVENANETNTMEIIAKLHHLMVHIKDTIQEATNYEITRQIASKFEKKAKILENNLFFIRSGDLVKQSRSGKNQSYKFFLFSDHLIYAHLNMKKEYVVHESLSLSALTVSDVETDPTFTSLYIQHPIKSFIVVSDSPSTKQQWIREISAAIANCKKRENALHDGPLNRRMSMITRIEDQQLKLQNDASAQLKHSTPSSQRARRGSYRVNEKTSASTDDSDNHVISNGDFTEHSPDDMEFQTVPFNSDTNPSTTSSTPMFSKMTSQKSSSIGVADVSSPISIQSQSERTVTSDGDEVPSLLSPEQTSSFSIGIAFHGNNITSTSENSTPAVTLPTPEERVQKQQEKVHAFQEIVENADENLLNGLFVAVSSISSTLLLYLSHFIYFFLFYSSRQLIFGKEWQQIEFLQVMTQPR